MTQWATKEGFFACQVPREKITVPNLGDIWVYGLTSGEKDDYENRIMQFNAGDHQFRMANARAVLLRMTVHNQHGKKLFAEKDIGKLCQVPAVIADQILTVSRRLSGMATGEIADLVKNSQTLQALEKGDSDSDSPDTSAGPKPKSEIALVPTS